MRTFQIDSYHDGEDEDRFHFLTSLEDEDQRSPIELTSDPQTVGRAESADITIEGDVAVSTSHCTVQVLGSAVMVEDLQSTNGTYVDREKVSEVVQLPVGSILRIGRTEFRHEFKSREELREQKVRADDLEEAVNYVRSLLPEPISEGPVRTEWSFLPSAKLGGDALGYRWVDEDRFAIYVLDVCGHGTGPALLSVSILNAIRLEAFAGASAGSPHEVLAGLNRLFPMGSHGNMYFTSWYGVYQVSTRELSYSSGGHPPSLLVSPQDNSVTYLRTKCPPVGMMRDYEFYSDKITVAPESRLYVFSDGVYEFPTENDEYWDLDEFYALLARPPQAGVSEPKRIENDIREVMFGDEFDDDFSLLVATFT